MIQFSQVFKSFGKQQVISNASFSIHPGERVGIVGPNGNGKSTLFEMLAGHQTPDKGEVNYPQVKRLGYMKQQVFLGDGAAPLLDYVENALPELDAIHDEIHELEHEMDRMDAEDKARALARLGTLQTEYEHLGGYELKNRAETILTGLGFNPVRFKDPFGDFSGGWKIRAELARVLVAKPDILLLDEPTNYLDVPAIEWLKDYLRAFTGTLLLVSHDRYLLNSLTSVTIEVMGGQVTRYPGNYDQYIKDRAARHDQLLAQKKNIDRKREQIERFVERFKYKATKAAQAQSRQKMLDRLEDVDVPQVTVKAPKITLPVPPPSGQVVVSLSEASFGYTPDKLLFEDVDLTIERGDKAAFVGLNGLGKTTLFRIFSNKLQLTGGKCSLGHGVEIGYQSQDFAETMDPDKTVFETVRAVTAEHSDGELRNMLGGFGFPGETIDKYVQVLSGGEKVRLALARLLLRPNNFLLLDEPTTHLDIYAREALEEALRNYQGTLCLVSHDITFVRNLATTIYELTPGKITRFYGNYDYYREKLAEVQQKSEEDNSEPSEPLAQQQEEAQQQPISRKERKREEANIRNEFSKIKRKYEQDMQDAEETVEKLEAEQQVIYDEIIEAKPGTDFATLNKRLAEIKKEIDDAYWQWDEATSGLEDVNKRCEEKIAALSQR